MADAAPSSQQQQQQQGQQIIQEYNVRRQRLSETARKVEELAAEAAEHELVLKTLEPMDKDRRCFRLIGDVLVERTTGETLPAVQQHKAKLDVLIKKLHADMEQQEQSLNEFTAKHKIRRVDQNGRPVDEDEEEGEGAAGSSSGSKGGAPQGVLVGKQ